MNEQIYSGELEECIDSLDSSDDATLAYICTDSSEWFHLDLDECRTNLTKQEWSRLNHVLLLLESDAELKYDRRTLITWRQPFAWIAILVGLTLWAALGASFFTHGFVLPFVLLAFFFARHFESSSNILYPFPSMRSLAKVRKSNLGFEQEPFPGDRNGTLRKPAPMLRIALLALFWPFLFIAAATPITNKRYQLTLNGELIDSR